MPKKLYQVRLTATEREQLATFVTQGKRSARAMHRARILLLVDAQHSDEEISDILGISRQTVYTMRKKYHEDTDHDLRTLLQEHPRPGQPVKVDSRVTSHVAMIACADSPPGTTRWTLQMIADRLVELNVVESICLESVREALKKTNANLGSTSGGV